MFKKILFLICIGLLSQSLSASPEVVIYETSGRGTKENPLPAGSRSTFTALIDGVEAWKLSGYGFEWRSNPQFVFFGSDTHTVSFELPSWSTLARFDVILTLHGRGGGKVYKKSFYSKKLSDGGGSGGNNPGTNPGNNPKNSPPSLSISASPTSASLGQTISLSASGSDPDGDSLSYRWFVNTTSSNLGTLFSSSKNTTYKAPNKIATLYFTAEVRDGVTAAVTKKLSVGVGSGGGAIIDDPEKNTSPVAKAVSNKTEVSSGETVVLDGSQSTDADGDTLTYHWTSHPNNPPLDLTPVTESSSKVSFVAPEVTEDTLLQFFLEVSDGQATSDSASVEVLVTSNHAPKIHKVVANPQKSSFAAGDKVELEVDADDADGDTLTYQWKVTGGPIQLKGANTPTLELEIGQVKDEANLVVRVTVSDGKSSVAKELSLSIGSSRRNQLVFPVNLGQGQGLLKDTFVGVAVMNPELQHNPVMISGTTEDGVTTAHEQKGLNGRGQLSFLTSESTTGVGASSLLVQGEAGQIRGFFMVGDLNLARLDGIGGELIQGEKLYFPVARHGDEATQVLYLFNPDTAEGASLKISLYDPEGQLLESTSRLLAPSGTVDLTIADIFAWGSESVQIEDGFLIVEASIPVLGFQYLVTERDLSSIAGQHSRKVETLLVPHILLAKDGGTEIRLLNTGSNSVHVNLEAFDDEGSPIGDAQFTINARKSDEGGKLFVADLAELIEVDTSDMLSHETLSGYLRLTLTGGKVGIFERPATVLGTITFYGNGSNFSSTLPMLEAGTREAFFLHVAQSLEVNMFTGLAILNPGEETAQIEVLAFNTEGEQTASVEFEVEPGKRRVDLLNGSQFFGPEFVQIGGHVKVISSQPVVSFSLFGSYDSMFLSAIEGQAAAE